MKVVKLTFEEKSVLFNDGKFFCTKCSKLKEISDFFKDKSSKFGITATCKDCRFEYKRSKRKTESIGSRAANELLNKNLKICPVCSEIFSLDMFNKNRTTKSGTNSYCKVCERKRRSNNLEKERLRSRKYYQSHKKEKLEYQRKRYSENPEFKCREIARSYLKRALKNINANKNHNTETLLGYSANDLKKHIEQKFKNGMTWNNHGEWHVDHIVPISLAKTLDQAIALSQLTNLQPLWAADNIRKGNKVIKEE